MFQTVTLETDPKGVARLTLNRPEHHHAIDARMMDELTEAARLAAQDPAIRVLILASSGPTFCAGGDLGWMRDQIEADGPSRATEARRLARMLEALDSLPKPLVAQVQGSAFGGGVGLLSVCDIVMAADTAVFALTETRLGLIPATIAPHVLARIGEPAARRLMLSARRITASAAVSMSLVARAVPPERLAEAVEEEVALLLAAAPGAVAEAKALLRSLRHPKPDAVERSVAALVARWESDEARAGVSAFFARRDPPWRSG